MMFWAMILEPKKLYDRNVKRSLHVSMASLDKQVADNTEVRLVLKKNNVNYLLCTLRKDNIWQVPLNLCFTKGEKITFLCDGTGRVHLTGYSISEEFSDVEEEEQVSEHQVPIEKGKKRKAESLNRGKKEKLAKQEFANGDDTQDEINENFESLEEDSESNNEGYDDDGEFSEEEDEKREKPAKSQKYEKKEIENKQQQKQIKKHDKQNTINGEETKQEQQSKKQKKKVENQNKTDKKVVEGGVEVEELVVGKGALATAGKLLTIQYQGYNLTGKKPELVDQCMNSNGTKFRLFRGNMIKGLSAGIAGMRTGGRRRIKIPPAMGYGSKGLPPSIPGNATLVYYVCLKNVTD